MEKLVIYPQTLIVLLQHGVFGKGYQLGGLCKLGAFFSSPFSYKEAGSMAHVVDDTYQGEEDGEDGKNEHCTIN